MNRSVYYRDFLIDSPRPLQEISFQGEERAVQRLRWHLLQLGLVGPSPPSPLWALRPDDTFKSGNAHGCPPEMGSRCPQGGVLPPLGIFPPSSSSQPPHPASYNEDSLRQEIKPGYVHQRLFVYREAIFTPTPPTMTKEVPGSWTAAEVLGSSSTNRGRYDVPAKLVITLWGHGNACWPLGFRLGQEGT